MKELRRLILENKAWAEAHKEADPEYFERMARSQSPALLWIGCADSRVPPDQILNTNPGQIFTHRNIANVVYSDDENLMSVIEYAVAYLKVQYIVVCGHYGCGGVQAAFDGIDNPRLAGWTEKIANIKKQENVKDVDTLVELNVRRQVETLHEVPVIKEALAGDTPPKIVGWVYDLKSGLINSLD